MLHDEQGRPLSRWCPECTIRVIQWGHDLCPRCEAKLDHDLTILLNGGNPQR